MRISVIGTGGVGRALAAALKARQHDVVMGTRDPQATLARTEGTPAGAPPFPEWYADHGDIPLLDLAGAGGRGELIVNATNGLASAEALHAAGPLDGKVVLDVANTLDFSHGFPPTIAVVNTDSLAEQLQREFPAARIVKTLNTMANPVMVNPGRLPEPTTVFLAGNDAAAKDTVSDLLQDLGWARDDILDLGALEAARGMEMYIPLWLRIMAVAGGEEFNIRVVRST